MKLKAQKNNNPIIKINKKTVVFSSTVLLLMLALMLAIYFIALRFKTFHVIQYDGYAISAKNLTENLYNINSEIAKEIETVQLPEQTVLYKNALGIFAGEEQKVNVNIEYPIYSNNKTALLMLGEDYSLITTDYETVQGYKGITLVRGIAYNYSDTQRADNNQYIFIKNDQDIFCNVYEIAIKTANREYTIPENSIIYFTKTFISYYILEGENFEYHLIDDIDLGNNISMNQEKYDYETFLKKIEIIGINTEYKEIIEEGPDNKENQNEINSNTTINNTQTNNEQTGDEQNKNNNQENGNQQEYVKPEIHINSYKANVYTLELDCSINDPARRVTSPITVTIYQGEDIYLRKQIKTGGITIIRDLLPNTEYRILVQYQYKNEEDQTVEKTILDKNVTTKTRDELAPVELSWENGAISTNKIAIKNLKILNDLSEESVLGIVKATILLNNQITYNIPTYQIQELIQGKEITVETTALLESNQKIEYEIHFYDIENQEIKITKNKGTTTTLKQQPQSTIQLTKQDITEVTLKVNLINKDKVSISNYYVSVFTLQGNFVKDIELSASKSEQKIILSDLSQDEHYVAQVYGTYSLDGIGTIENEVMDKVQFTTKPISALGYLTINAQNTEQTDSKLKYKLKIDSIATSADLILYLKEYNISLYNGEQEVEQKRFSEEEIENLKNGELIEISFKKLKSNTEYNLEMNAKIQLGGIVESVPVIQKNSTKVKTLKKVPTIEVKEQFVTENMIDMEVRLIDEDNAIEGDTIKVEFTDEKGKIVSVERLAKGQEFKRYTYSSLEKNKLYTLNYIAEQYNISDSNATYKTNKVLRTIQIKTESGISGSLKLENILRKADEKNLADMQSTDKWQTLFFNNGYNYLKEYNEQEKILTLGIKGAYRYYSYDLTDYIGENITISFLAKSTYQNNNVYLITERQGGTTKLLNGINTSNWTSYEFTVKNMSGYVGFYTANNGVMIKNLQIELGSKKTDYEEYKSSYYSDFAINLVDAKNEISTKDYYFRIYQEDTLIINEHYAGFENSNIVQDKIYKKLENNKNYRAELAIIIREKEYVIDTCEFTIDNEEVKGIGTTDEFKWLQVDGNYIFTNDIDLTDATGNTWYCGQELKAHLNFNGYSLTKGTKTQTQIFEKIGEAAVIENMVFNVDFSNNTSGYITYTRPLFNNNYGTIQNIQVNFIGTKDARNTQITLLGTNNYGTISNFVINMQEKLYCSRLAGMLCIYNQASGIIKNGYAYGENIQATYPINSGQWKDIGVFTYSNSGIIENVYSLVNVITKEQSETIYQNIGNIVDSNTGTVRNSYSVGYGYQKIYTAGPGIARNSKTLDNVYYFTKNYTFDNTKEKRAPYYALENILFQNTILNSNQGFNTDSLISLGYYPHVNLPSCMETQEYIPLPVSIEEREIGILYNKVIETTDNSAIVDVTITNKTGESFKSIEVKDAESTIISQSYKDGISVVRIKLENPRVYISKYSILAIETEDFFGTIGIKKEYKENVHNIEVDFYRPISSIEDWKKINNSPTENYKLYADLNFAEEGDSICITKTTTGILNGNNHTISNIILPENTTKTLFNTIEGSLLNLNIDNYYLKTKNSGRIGVINCTAGAESKVIGCNFSNIYLDNNGGISSSTYYMGVIGIVNTPSTGISTALINNTINNITIISNGSNNTIAGSLLGYTAYAAKTTEISNCYVQNCNIQVKGASQTNGIGALAGYLRLQTVKSCYATGNIASNTSYLGGLVGYTSSKVTQSYSNVNIISDNNNPYMGGIIGYDASNSSSNNLALGNLYIEMNNPTATNMKRCYGNRNNVDYAYDEQKINGIIMEDIILGASQLLTKLQLSSANTYINIIQLGDDYDYSEVSKEILPKLYYQGTTELLPGQEDNSLIKDKGFSLESITPMRIDKESFRVTGNIVVPNDSIQVTGIEIENTKVEIENLYEDSGVYKFQVKATVQQYIDSYQISKIYYLEDGIQKEQAIAYKIDLIYYKEIPTVEEWQKINPEVKQNYKITGDINFENIANPIIEVKAGRIYAEQAYTISNLNIQNGTSLIKEISYTIENLNFENITINNASINSPTGVVATNFGTAKNLSFNNITITSKYVYTGPIGKQVSNFNNIISSNVTIVSTNSYVGGITGVALTTGDTLKVENSTVTGVSYIGGTIGQGNANNVTGNSNKIKGTGSYIGGILGYGYGQNLTYIGTYNEENPSDTPDVLGGSYIGGITGGSGSSIAANYNITDAWIQGTNYVGGIVGIYHFKTSSANHIKVQGANYVGGLGGGMSNSYDSTGQTSTIENSTIIGTDYVGGIFGQGCMPYNPTNATVSASNCTIEGDNYVGGIAGLNYGSGIIRRGEIFNSTIGKSNSNYVGTIVGRTGNNNSVSVYRNYAQDCTVIGNSNIGGIAGSSEYASGEAAIQAICYNYNNSIIRASGNNVGGIVGALKQGSVYENYNNAKITSTGNNIGGIVGYLDNSKMQVDTEGNGKVLNKYISKIYNNYVARTTISGAQNVAGVIGAISTLLNNSYIEGGVVKYNYEKNYVDADIYSVDENAISIGIGNKIYNAELDNQLKNTYIYRFSKINGVSVTDLRDNYYIKNNYNFVSSQLKQQTTYTQILGWASANYDYSSLANNQYPILKDIPGQIGITIPEDDAVVSSATMMTMAIKRSRAGEIVYQKVELPEITCYPVSASEINLEFSNISSNLSFTYSMDNQGISSPIEIKQRTYTFQYDYTNVITIEVSNGVATDTFVIEPSNYLERVTKVQDEYFYLIGNKLSSNKRVLEGEFVHIYGDKALSIDGYVYDLNSLSRSSDEKVSSFELEQEVKALGEYEYNNKTILNFAKYTVIKDGNSTVERDTQIFVKNGRLEILDSSSLNIVPNKIIIDSYNNNEYETVLGTNGVLYNLKSNIKFPEELSNERIESITNNLEEEDNIIVIYYKTGRVCAFDYITGEIKFDNQVKADISFWEYLNEMLELETEDDEQLEKIQETYQQSLEVKDKLIAMPLTEQTTITAPGENTNSQSNTSQNTVASSVASSKSYITVYDSSRQEYVVYKVEEVLNTTNQEVVSENTKIEMQGLDSVYYESAKKENAMTNKGIVYIVVCIILVLIALNILSRRTSNISKNKSKKDIKKL